jgi:tRNA-Thr(GGU) m(6)t(6)A37 methyltransferase TsaA
MANQQQLGSGGNPLLIAAGVAAAVASLAVCLALQSLAKENERLRNKLRLQESKPAEHTAAESVVEIVAANVADSAEIIPESEQPDRFSCLPVGFVSSCFEDCQGTPRQPALAPAARAVLLLKKGISPTTLCGLADHSHVWVLFLFHKNNNGLNLQKQNIKGYTFRSKVNPPRCADKVGCLATRTPHRPNPVGLTLARIHEVRISERQVLVSGSDLVDGSPILDIKPYLPAYDSPEARKDGPSRVASWSEEQTFELRVVTFNPDVIRALSGEEDEGSESGDCAGRAASALRLYSGEPHEALVAITQVLAADVSRRSKMRADGTLHRYRMRFDGVMVEYTLEGAKCHTHVLSVHAQDRRKDRPERSLEPPAELRPTRKWRWGKKGGGEEGKKGGGGEEGKGGGGEEGKQPTVPPVCEKQVEAQRQALQQTVLQPSAQVPASAQAGEQQTNGQSFHRYKEVSRRKASSTASINTSTTASTTASTARDTNGPLTPELFREQYLSACRPVLIEGALEAEPIVDAAGQGSNSSGSSGSSGSSDGGGSGSESRGGSGHGWQQCVERRWSVRALRARFGERSVVVRRDAASDNYRLGKHTPLERMRFDRYACYISSAMFMERMRFDRYACYISSAMFTERMPLDRYAC